ARNTMAAHAGLRVDRLSPTDQHLLWIAAAHCASPAEGTVINQRDRPPSSTHARACRLCGGAGADDHEIVGAHDWSPLRPFHASGPLRHWPRLRHRAAGFGKNDPRASAEGDIGPQPIERDDDARAEADEKINMGKDPKEPCEAAVECYPAEIDDCFVASDRCQTALMSIAEWRRWRGFLDARPDHGRSVTAHLLCGGSNARSRLSFPALGNAGIADRKNFRVMWNRE